MALFIYLLLQYPQNLNDSNKTFLLKLNKSKTILLFFQLRVQYQLCKIKIDLTTPILTKIVLIYKRKLNCFCYESLEHFIPKKVREQN